MNLFLIVDSGSTKADWLLAETGQGEITRFTSPGMNPFFQSVTEMKVTLRQVEEYLHPFMKGCARLSLFFYGAGCTPEKTPLVEKAIRNTLTDYPFEQLEVAGDLLGAARALCGTQEGIACILGTGSNSCHYDGQIIRANVSSLGFILGDEGSGAVLGRLLVGDLLKGQLPASLREEFLRHYSLTPADIIEKVYRQPFPNRFLASFSPFLHAHLDDPSVYNLVENAFTAFFRRNVMRYKDIYLQYPVHLTGSVAYYYQDLIRQAATSLGITLGTITRSPLDGLLRYHSDKKQA